MKKVWSILQASGFRRLSTTALGTVSLLLLRLLIGGDYEHDPSAFGGFGLAATLSAPVWLPVSAILAIPLAFAAKRLIFPAPVPAKTANQPDPSQHFVVDKFDPS